MNAANPTVVFGVRSPAWVQVTTDPERPVSNELTLTFTNHGTEPVTFVNPDGLTPESGDLPAYGDPTPNPLSRFYVTFPWGTGEHHMTTPGESKSVVASKVTPGWTAAPASHPDLGVYWIVFPSSKEATVEPDQSVEVHFTGIVATLPAGTSEAESWFSASAHIGTYSTQMQNVAVWKRVASATLTPSRTWVRPGAKVTLTWATSGVSFCYLDPGERRDLPANGSVEAEVAPPSTTYRLTAFLDGRPSIKAETTVQVRTGWVDVGPSPIAAWVNGVLLARDGTLVAYDPTDGGLRTSADGSRWESRGKGPPLAASSVRGVSGGERLWLMGHDGTSGHLYSSSDGVDWRVVTAVAPWTTLEQAAAAWFRGRLWVMGGALEGELSNPTNRVWSSPDGLTWTEHAPPPWSPRRHLSAAVFGDRLWILGGWTRRAGAHDAWSTADGESWAQEPAPPWSAVNVFFPTPVAATPERLYALPADDDLNVHVWRLGRDGRWSEADAPVPFPGWDQEAGAPTVVPWGDGMVAAGRRTWVYVPVDGAA